MIRQSLSAAVIADALDSLGFRNQSPRVPLRPLTGVTRLAGRCKTTLWEDLFCRDLQPYELELRAIDSAQPDDVLLCAAAGSLRSALWGELLSTAARRVGAAGAIVDGATRDIQRITQMGFPVFGRGTSVYDSQDRQRVVEFDTDVEIDGVVFEAGALVIADVDGVVVVPRDVEEETLQLAWNKANAESEVRQAIENGMSATEAYRKFGVL